MKSVKGFTLIELLIVVAIVAILASIGVPAYQDYVTRGKLAEAYATLGSQRVKLEQYYADLRTYTGACVAGTSAPLPVGTNFTYACNIAADGQSYSVTATGNSSQNMNGFTLTIDQNNNRATTSVPSGWTSSATCWIRSKDGKC